MNKHIIIKPHHFLDIIKLYGNGFEQFIPNKGYRHDFYKVGNTILSNKSVQLTLTLKGDSICEPCKYFKKGECQDKIKKFNIFKEEWNKIIDSRLFKELNLKEGQKITALELCQIAKNKLDVSKIWKERPKEETILREKI